jgi:quercetin dioxygenase-like cupin family protein
MMSRSSGAKRALFAWAVATSGLLLSPSVAAAAKFEIKPVAEKRIPRLPAGPLFWRIDNFPTLAQAQAAAGPAALAAEIAGKAWLFTLETKGGSSPAGSKVTEIGPVPAIAAPEYLLRVNSVSGSPGVKTRVHTHPGVESFYVLAGELTQQTPRGVSHIGAGQSRAGKAPDTPMQVTSGGTSEVKALVMFVTDATRPFSSPAQMP